MIKRLYIIAITFGCCLVSCSDWTQTDAQYHIRVSGFEDKEYTPEELGITIKALIVDPDALLSCITSIQLPSDGKSLYITDGCMQNITVIDRQTGEIRVSKKMQGRGPGEYLDVGILKIQNDTVVVYDEISNKSFRYDLNLDHIDSKELRQPVCHEYIDVEDGVLGYNMAISDMYPCRIYHKDRDYNLLGTYIEMEDHSIQRSVFELGSRFAKNKRGDVLISYTLNNDIYAWDDGTRLKYTVDFGKRNQPRGASMSYGELFNADYFVLQNFFEVRDRLIFSFATLADSFYYHGFYDRRDGSLTVGRVAPENELLFVPRWQNGDELIGYTLFNRLPPDIEVINRSRFDGNTLDESSVVVLFYTFDR